MILAEIPLLSDTTDQTVDVVLSDEPYTLRVLWNEKFQYFALSVLERSGTIIIENIKMVPNYPLIGRFKDTRLPVGDFFFYNEQATTSGIRPTYYSIGDDATETKFGLLYYVPDVVEEVSTVSVSTAAPVSGSVWDSGLSTWDSGSSVWDE